MAANPPTFQEAARCDVCNCSFTTFRRRHHCRSCGRTLCNEHSSYYMALPQFGIYSNVRVCLDCLNSSSRSGSGVTHISPDNINAVTNSISNLVVTEDVEENVHSTVFEPVKGVDCRCGMPLCICIAQVPDLAATTPSRFTNSSFSTAQIKPRQRKEKNDSDESSSQKVASLSSGKPSSSANIAQLSHGSLNEAQADYDVSGEGLREAIKKSDVIAVKNLLRKGVDANYCDKQGFTLLHLAALFNQTEIAIILLEHGALLDCKNAQGETPVDCAPTMLQYKMCQWNKAST